MSLILSGCGDNLADTIANEPPWRESFYVTIAPELLNRLASAFYLLTIPPLLILTLVPVITGGDWGLEYGKGMGLMIAAAITPMVFNLLTQIGQGMFFPEELGLPWVADLMGWLEILEGDSNPVTVNLAAGFTREIPNYYKIWEMLLGLTIITLVAIAVINVSFKPILMAWVLAGAWAMFPMAYYTLVTEFAEGMPNVVEATLSNYNGSYLIAVILLFITMTVVPPALMIVFAPALGLSTRRSTNTQTVSTNQQTSADDSDAVDGTARDADGIDGAIVALPFPIDGSDGEDGDNTVSSSTSNGPSGPNGGGSGAPGGPGGVGGNGDGQDADPNVVLGSPEDANQPGDSAETDIDSRTVVSEESSLGDTVVDGDDSLLIDSNDDTSVVESEGIEGGDLDLSAVTVEGDSSQIQETDIENLGDNSDITAGDSAVAVGGDSPIISGGDLDVISSETLDRVGRTPDITGADEDAVLQDTNVAEEVSVSLQDDVRDSFDFPDVQGVEAAARYDRQDRVISPGEADGVVDANVVETTTREIDLDTIVADSHPDATYVEVSELQVTERPRVNGRNVARTVGDLAHVGAGMVSDPRAKVVLGIAGTLVDVFVPEERPQSPTQSSSESLQPPDLSKYDDDIVEEEVT